MRERRSFPVQLGSGLLICGIFQWTGRATAGATPPLQLPVPCIAALCGSNATTFVSAGTVASSQVGNTLTLNQTTNTATLNWRSFNIGANGKVVFQQPSSTSIALNRIFDTNPSSIFGTLSANGQVYLINANGFLFGSGAAVSVGGLLASSLNLSDATLASGILTPGTTGQSALQPFVDSSGSVVSQDITVQQGATLTAAGGRLLLAAPNVYNAGSLNTPDGQVILAAGQTLYLQASSNSDLRGLIVEVDGGGKAVNQSTGILSAPRGNVTLTGLMVNQDGRVSATTSVAANGSVILQAADTTQFVNDTTLEATNGGTVELGAGSVTSVLPEYADTTTAVAAQKQLQSSVSITGEQVLMHGATIDAPSGVLSVVAAADPAALQSAGNPNAQIRIDAGTTIDLSGSQAQLPMAANLVNVQLRSNEFADDPTQRNGALQSTPANTVTVTVDIRADGGLGTPIADLQSAIAAVGQTIAQRTETGGTATFQSEGDVVLSPGAKINVSGGSTTYLGGTIQTTELIGSDGQLYNIGTANPLLKYSGVINPTFTQSFDKWNVREVVATPGLSQYESTYVQGASAGSVQFAAPSLSLAGTLQGSAVSGPNQRGAPPSGGTLVIGVAAGVINPTNNIDYFAPGVSVVSSPTPVSIADGAPLPVQTLQLPAAYLTSDGFTSTQIYSNTSISLPAGLPLQLPAGASLSFTAPRIDLDSSISAVDGHLSFQNVLTSVAPGSLTPRPGVAVGDGVTLDVSGQWTNDASLAGGIGTAPTYQNGGSINLQLTNAQSELALGNNVSLLANGGAWLQSGGNVTYGAGGSLTLDASPAQSAIQFGAATAVQAFGTGTASGGSFTLLAPRINVSQGDGSSWTLAQRADDLNATSGPVLDLFAPLFSDYGFSSISLTATGAVQSYVTNDVMTVASGTTLNAQTSTLQLNPNYLDQSTGAPVLGFTQPSLLPLYERPATNLAFSVLRLTDDVLLGNTGYGVLDIQAGASILTDPGSTITIAGEGGVAIGGTLRAPGGKIQVSIPAPADISSAAATITDPGYVPTLGIDLAATAVLDAGGITVATPNSSGLSSGTLLPGGSIMLLANRGTVIAQSGSMIDVSGTAASLDVANAGVLGGYTLETVASAGGSLVVSSPESISLLGSFSAAAGVGNSGKAAAGSLEVDLVRSGDSVVQSSGPQLPGSTLEIELVNTTAGGAPSPADSNVAVLGIQEIANSGIDSLTLRAGTNILFDAPQLSLGRQLILDAPNFVVPLTSSVYAPFVEIGNSISSATANSIATPSAGHGELTIGAQQMVLLGDFAVQEAAGVTLSSAGDVQLRGTVINGAAGPNIGTLVTNGNLTINALRIYPDTYTDFTITSAPGNGATVSFGSTGTSTGAPLSADGSLTVAADNISVAGTLLAPFGTIDLGANRALTVASGSLISVSGAGLDIPFGETQINQSEWIYTTPGGSVNPITSVPTKQIVLSGPSITVQSGATANVQGGGDLYAYEWVPGTGGTYDNLNALVGPTAANGAVSNLAGLYAILPAARGQAAPYDPEESTLAVPGQSIYLSGGAGIAAGYYSLLPPRYALAPGAVLIQLEPTVVSASGGQIGTLASGTPVIGGFLSVGTTGLHTTGLTEYEGVAIYPAGYAQQLAAYTINNASSYFGAIATEAGTGPVAEPADSGTFTVSITPAATNTLHLQGSVLTAAALGGRGAQINISAPDLEITAGNTPAGYGSIAVSGSILQGWNAASLTLGGVATAIPASGSGASATAATTDIAVAANSVTVDSGVQLSAEQIELVAQQTIDIRSGAALQSTSGKSGEALTTLPVLGAVQLTDTSAAATPLRQAALLAVSDLSLPVVTRGDASATAMNGIAGATITLEQGATLGSGGALSVDTPGNISLAGTLNTKGASLSLSSGSIAFAGNGTSADSLTISSGLLTSLQQAGSVRLSSQSSIDIESPVSLGVDAGGPSTTLSSLTLIGNSINNQAGGDSVFGAGQVTLGGNILPVAGTPVTAAAAGTGSLSFVANGLTIASGDLSINGFSQTTARVAGAVETSGASYLNVGGNLAVNAGELTPAPSLPGTSMVGSTIAAGGNLVIGASSASSGTLPALVGGSLTLAASDIADSGAIVAPSGVVELFSTGNIHLLPTASIDASGTVLQAATQSAASPGGLVILSAGGDLNVDAGSSIDVAGSARAPAGSLIVSAPGAVALAGTLDGAAAGNTGGSLTIDAGNLSGGLMSLVSNAGLAGFSNSVNVRVHTGDLDLASTGSITSNNVSLAADTGVVDIAGVLSAPSAALRGLIDLSGGAGVTLESTGQLHADASGTSGRGGEIDINSVTATCDSLVCVSSGSINLAAGSVITTVGAAQMGELVLRAPALMASNDVAINAGGQGIGANVAQAGQVIVEPVLVAPTTSSTVDSDLSNNIGVAANYLTTAAPVIAARLTGTTGKSPSIQAGVELQDANAADALTLQAPVDLSSYSTQGQVIDVSVRASGSITLDGTFSDGFVQSAGGTTLSSMPSGTWTFVAGADLSGANALTVLSNSSAALTLGSQSIVRTGTGNINLAAAGDVFFLSDTSGGATVYTGGVAGTNPLTFGTGNSRRDANFATGGGNLNVAAGGDVDGGPFLNANLDAGNFSVSGWQPRAVNGAQQGQYGVDFDGFDWNVGALGGGDVKVAAAGSVMNLSAATADSSPDGNTTLYGAGGGMRIAALGDIGSAQIYVADGIGTLTANGGLTPVLADAAGSNVGSSIALGSSQVSVWARQSVQIDAVYNPTFTPAATRATGNPTQFFTYGPNSSLNVSSTDDDVTLELIPTKAVMGALLGPNLVLASGAGAPGFLDLPASVSLQALQQDIDLNVSGGGAILYPSSTGQLALFAGQNIVANGSQVAMSDSLAAAVSTAAMVVTPQSGPQSIGGLSKFSGAIHGADATPVLISAGLDIEDLGLDIPKAAQISAGRDIIDLAYQGQNIAATDTTLITAGRDISYDVSSNAIQLGGEGSLDVFAGRNVNLGVANGITTTGNLENANLPSASGADLTIAVGYGTQGADYSLFEKTIIAPSAIYQAQLVAYTETQTGQTDLKFPQAQAEFATFTASQQAALVDSVFFNELLLSGRAANLGKGVGFAQGYAAVDALFPYSRTPTAAHPQPYSGSLDLISSQIYTLSGGNISLVVPGGAIDVGLAYTPVGVTQKPASQLGIVAEGSGNVNIYAQGDVNVNVSRIFTLGGGNILIWSDQGSIDAGNGSKSSLSVPPPVVLIAADGSISLDYGASLAAGSGIRTIQTNPSVAAGDVDLDAPVGTVDAGDAGIGAAGNINIAAAHVIGALNINFGGNATGVPSDLSGLAASLSGVSAVANSATTSGIAAGVDSNEQRETAPLAQTALSWLEVFVTGLGEENCKQDDVECLKRQKSAAP